MARSETVLAYFIAFWGGMHPAAWRLDDAPANPQMDFENIKDLVRKSEAAKIQALFLADGHAVWPERTPESAARTSNVVRFDPLTLSTALAGCTEHIGLALTMSTTYNEPWHVARFFASLDHLSGGRACWNIVTSGNPDDAGLFGFDEHMDHELRYRRAAEFYDVVTGFWDTFEDDAFALDKKSGLFFDPEKMHPLAHTGEFFSAKGALAIDRPIQGYPVIAQAGQSEDGLAFAARLAELMFVHETGDFGASCKQYERFKGLIVDAGRDADDAVILKNTTVVLGRTTEEAQDRLQQMATLLDPIVGLERLRFAIDFDVSDYPQDGPLPFDDIPVANAGPQSLQAVYLERARAGNHTIREMAELTAGDFMVPLSVKDMADYISEHHGKTCDGFCMNFADANASAHLFFDQVIPELQRRGIFQKEYKGKTLRDNLGLKRPQNHYVAQSPAKA